MIPRTFASATLGAVAFATIAVVARFAAADNPSASAPPSSSASSPTTSAGGPALRASWEFSPYRVLVYVKSTASPRAAPLRLAEFAAALDSEREKQLGGIWKLTVSAAPAKLPWDLPGEPQRVTADQLAVSPNSQDKVLLLGIDGAAAETVLTVRELDVRTGLWGATTTTLVPPAERVPAAALRALWDAFSPLVRIDDIADTGVTCRIRGGGLLPSGKGPELLKPGDVLLPIVRHFDAQGETVKGGVFPVAWTWLSVESAEAGLARCSLSTGVQEPLALVYDGRTEYLGLTVRTRAADATELVVHARGPGDKPLEDLEILARIGKDKQPQPIGRTDARGAVKIESPKIELLTLYVRSGSDLLARVPLVPGVEPTLALAVDDNGRRADSGRFIASLDSALLDIIAQKSMLALRINREFAGHEFDKVEKTFGELKALPTAEAFSAAMDAGRAKLKSGANGTDAAAAAWLDKQFAEIKPLAAAYLLTPQQLAAMDAALKNAKGN